MIATTTNSGSRKVKSKKKAAKKPNGLAALFGKGLPPRPKDQRQAPPEGPTMPMGGAKPPVKASIKKKKSKRSRNAGRS